MPYYFPAVPGFIKKQSGGQHTLHVPSGSSSQSFFPSKWAVIPNRLTKQGYLQHSLLVMIMKVDGGGEGTTRLR